MEIFFNKIVCVKYLVPPVIYYYYLHIKSVRFLFYFICNKYLSFT